MSGQKTSVDLEKLVADRLQADEVGGAVRRRWRLGLGALGAFISVLLMWSLFAPLSSAALVSGVVSPEGSRKTVQHLEGGILAEIRVAEGERVRAGQVLAVIDRVRAQADVAALEAQLIRQLARLARLEAERAGAEAVAFTHPRLQARSAELEQILLDQQRQFAVRQDVLARQLDVLGSRKAQLEGQATGFRAQRAGVLEQKRLIEEEIGAVSGLVRKGLAQRPRLLALQRRQAELNATAGRLSSDIARAEEAKGATDFEILSLKAERAQRLNDEFDRVDGERKDLEEQLAKFSDVLQRTEIRAPVSGRVLNLAYKSAGGVIPPGGTLLELVPDTVELIVEGRLSPQDVDNVREGMDAKIYFPSLPVRTQPRLDATVRYRSPDSVEEPRTGTFYYKIWLEVPESELTKLQGASALVPGMPAEAFVFTGRQTILEYLFAPLSQSLRRSFREE